MAVGTPTSSTQVEDRMKADVQREAPDSNPFLSVHWLRSLIAGIARRIFDFYDDLRRTEQRVFPDTADEETAPRWGNIYVGPPNAASVASGVIVATGTPGGNIVNGTVLSSGVGDYTVTAGDVIASTPLTVDSITRVSNVVTVTTNTPHNLSSFVPVTISGATQTEYNITDAEITITGLNTFTYEIVGSPVTPATGTIAATSVSASVTVQSVDFGSETNLTPDTPLTLQSPIVNVDDTFYVTFGEVGGGTDAEATDDYKERYLDKIRNPVAHFNVADIVAKAKEVPGVTRVFVEPAGTTVGTIGISTLTRNNNVATVVTPSPHGFTNGQVTTIIGATQTEYNVVNVRIIIEDAVTFHYVVDGTPTTPATGTITATTSVPLGQVRTFFMRDNDTDTIPSASEVQDVQDALNTILPATTAEVDNIVEAPSAVVVDYTFTDLSPDTPTMQAAIEANLAQFHAEQTSVGVNVDEDSYRAAITNTVDPDTGDIVQTFTLSAPSGDITIDAGQIATKGAVTF